MDEVHFAWWKQSDLEHWEHQKGGRLSDEILPEITEDFFRDQYEFFVERIKNFVEVYCNVTVTRGTDLLGTLEVFLASLFPEIAASQRISGSITYETPQPKRPSKL